MRSIRLNLSALRLVRFLVAACVSVVLVFSQAFPAYSDTPMITGKSNAPQQGESQLLDIEQQAQKAVLKDPMSRAETQSRSQQGSNEIQGSADLDKMKRTDNSQATTVEDKSKSFLEAMQGKK